MTFFAQRSVSVFAAVLYGILHDQVTARICVEYFTVGHPPMFGTDDPTLLGIGWGILATWWVGMILGIGLAVAARMGRAPKRTVGSMIRPIATLLATMGVSAIVAGVCGGILASLGAVFLVGHVAERLPTDRHVPFLIDLWAHSTSYLVGFVGGAFVIAKVRMSRSRVREASADDVANCEHTTTPS